MNLYLLALFGLFGGMIRAIVGMLKHKVFSAKGRFKPWRLITSLVASSLIGLFCALMIVEDYRIVLLAGYAGTDLIQGIYTVVKK